METIASLLEQYGYAAIFIGAFLEGETILALGGFAAQRGHLDLFTVIAVGFVGGFLGDQLFFYLGRRHGDVLLARFPSLALRLKTVDALLSRYHAPLIFGIRFMYGLRIAGPIALGMGRVSAGKFFLFNLLGAMVWAIIVAYAGFWFGATLELVLADIKRVELIGVGIIALISVALWVRYILMRK